MGEVVGHLRKLAGKARGLGARDYRGWLAVQPARVRAYYFYATRLRFRNLLVFDVGANHGSYTARMLNQGARVVAIEPQAKLAAELAERFPGATVLATAVGDEPGHAVLHLVAESDEWASLDADWRDVLPPAATVVESEVVSVTTLDELINEYGQPALIKIDTEGFDHRVLRGLSRPIEHILFEVHADRPNDAADALQQIEHLGRYEYRISAHETWRYREPKRPEEILAELPSWGNVYARRTR